MKFSEFPKPPSPARPASIRIAAWLLLFLGVIGLSFGVWLLGQEPETDKHVYRMLCVLSIIYAQIGMTAAWLLDRGKAAGFSLARFYSGSLFIFYMLRFFTMNGPRDHALLIGAGLHIGILCLIHTKASRRYLRPKPPATDHELHSDERFEIHELELTGEDDPGFFRDLRPPPSPSDKLAKVLAWLFIAGQVAVACYLLIR